MLQAGLRCRRCRRTTLHQAEPTNHVLHLVLTIFTGGLWLLGWFVAAAIPPVYRCSQCGLKWRGR